ncbi:MAG: ABC transporter permease [Gammaproteobacteria bacterium]
MNQSVHAIPLINLAIAFLPAAASLFVLYKWSLRPGYALYALFRMLVQLFLIGYFLVYIFDAGGSLIILAVLAVMVLASSWIALSSLKIKRLLLFKYAFVSIALGGGTTLLLVTRFTLELEPWYWPQYMIPLAGMIFANCMNCISLTAERLLAETARNVPFDQARNEALHAALIPVINSLFAVGLVSLPGMMTGQILSGISPLVAARYQVMVMAMIFGSACLSAACFLKLAKPVFSAGSVSES